MSTFIEKQLRARGRTNKGNLDIIVLVDGSGSVREIDFQKSIKVCLAISQRLAKNSQLCVIQFGSTAVMLHPLSSKTEEFEQKAVSMTQVGGSTNLNAALDLCFTEFGLSRKYVSLTSVRCPTNAKQVWIVTDGAVDSKKETSLKAQKLKREHQATILAIGVGAGVTISDLNLVTSQSCCFLVSNYDAIFKIIEDASAAEYKVQMEGTITFPKQVPYRLGEEVCLSVKIENVGSNTIPAKSRIIFKDNAYFKEKNVFIPKNVELGEELSIDVKLVPKTKGHKANLDEQVMALPELLELSVFDASNHAIECDIVGLCLNHEDFSGDVYLYKPLYNVPYANITTFGPPGAGKSTFVSSVYSTLTDSIKVVNVAGATRQVVTSGLLQFPLHELPGLEEMNFSLYDCPGIDGKNYKGDEIDMMMHGILPLGFEFKDFALKYKTVHNRRSSEKEELERRTHVVAFFIPQGSVGDSVVMDRLQEVYYKITVSNARKAIVIISHADEIIGDDAKADVVNEVCEKLSIDSTGVFLLENYVNSKSKVFQVDKSVLRILLAMVNRADDFLTYDRLNPTNHCFSANPNPTGAPQEEEKKSREPQTPPKGSNSNLKASFNNPGNNNTKTSNNPNKKPEPTSGSSPSKSRDPGLDSIFNRMAAEFREKLMNICDEQGIDDVATFKSMTKQDWAEVGIKQIGDIKKISAALNNKK